MAPWTPFSKHLVALAFVAAGLIHAWMHGANYVQAKWDRESEREEIRLNARIAELAHDKVRIADELNRKLNRARRVAKLSRSVPEFINEKAELDCAVPVGFKRLHDSTAKNLLPEPPSRGDETNSGVGISAVATTVIRNYAKYHEIAARLAACKAWASEVSRDENEREDSGRDARDDGGVRSPSSARE